MAPEEGFEPPADRLTADCSTTELLRNGTIGGRDRNRTDIEGFAVLCITTLPLGLSRSSSDPLKTGMFIHLIWRQVNKKMKKNESAFFCEVVCFFKGLYSMFSKEF